MTDLALPRRTASRTRETRETRVSVDLDLDGFGQANVKTGVGFYDHLLSSLAHHALFDLTIDATGDIDVDEHHTVEDVSLVLGDALAAGAGRPSPDRALRRCVGAHGRGPRHGGRRSLRAAVRGALDPVPRRADRDLADAIGRARAGVLLAHRRPDAPPDGDGPERSPRGRSRRSRRWRVHCGRQSRSTRGASASPAPRDSWREGRPGCRRRLRRRQHPEHHAGHGGRRCLGQRRRSRGRPRRSRRRDRPWCRGECAGHAPPPASRSRPRDRGRSRAEARGISASASGWSCCTRPRKRTGHAASGCCRAGSSRYPTPLGCRTSAGTPSTSSGRTRSSRACPRQHAGVLRALVRGGPDG